MPAVQRVAHACVCVVSIVLAHCGGSVAPDANAAPADGGPGSAGDSQQGPLDAALEADTGGCPPLTQASMGTPCTEEGLTCPAPTVWCEASGPGRLTCEAGRWAMPLGCWEGGVESGSGGGAKDAGSFACGSTTCAPGEYCTDHPPGIAPAEGGSYPDAYLCMPLPATCASSPTCGCIESTIPTYDACSTKTPGVSCSADAEGHVTIRCLGE